MFARFALNAEIPMTEDFGSAREYAELFETGLYGRLWLHVGAARQGRAFEIYVVPEGFVPGYLGRDAVQVYGLLGTEEYGWKHDGPWQDDFERLVIDRRAEIELAKAQLLATFLAEKHAEESRIEKLLAAYSEVVQ